MLSSGHMLSIGHEQVQQVMSLLEKLEAAAKLAAPSASAEGSVHTTDAAQGGPAVLATVECMQVVAIATLRVPTMETVVTTM